MKSKGKITGDKKTQNQVLLLVVLVTIVFVLALFAIGNSI